MLAPASSSFKSRHVIAATYNDYTCQEKLWSPSGITAVVLLGIIALLFVIAGIAFAFQYNSRFLPKLKPKLKRSTCMLVRGCCTDFSLKAPESSTAGRNGTRQPRTNFEEISMPAPAAAGGSFHFSIQLLRDATDNFCKSNIVVDQGVSGTVYRGELCNGTMVAVQRLRISTSCEEMDEFQARISILAKVRHAHLVTLLGCCIQSSDVLLVYEYEQHSATLSRHLVAWKDLGSAPLSWATRLNIALDAARGLEFLHRMGSAQHSFIHGYLKSSNVLVSHAYKAKVSDYGSFLVLRSDLSAKTRLALDNNYMAEDYLAPEYNHLHDIAPTGILTEKTDVFSFGLVLMELISTGSEAFFVDKLAHAQAKRNWATLFKALIDDEVESTRYIDKSMLQLAGNETSNIEGNIRAVAKLASNCIASNAVDRPEMSYVINTLSLLLGRLSIEETQVREAATATDHVQDMSYTSLSEALKKWQAFDNYESNSVSNSETNFQIACTVRRPALMGSPPAPIKSTTVTGTTPKEMDQ